MLDRVTLRQLRIFAAAAQHLHFGRAAEELNLTQPAVSIQLKELELEVGMPLFERMGRRTHLTSAGAELWAHVRDLLARLREADEAMESLRGRQRRLSSRSRRRRPPNISLRIFWRSSAALIPDCASD